MLDGSPTAVPDLSVFRQGSLAIFLYGSSRTVVLRTAYALARANDVEPYWIDVRDPTDVLDPPGPVELGWIPEDHLFVVSRSDAKPQDAVSNLAIWTVIRSDEPEAVIGGLADFLRLPMSIQEALSQYGRETQRPVFVVANVDRVRDSYPRDVSGVRGVIDAMLHAKVAPIFAAVGPPGPGRFAFDLVFEVEAPDLKHWQEGFLRCERSSQRSGFHTDQKIPLTSHPGLVAALEGHRDPPR
jgi:hypothetical protein